MIFNLKNRPEKDSKRCAMSVISDFTAADNPNCPILLSYDVSGIFSPKITFVADLVVRLSYDCRTTVVRQSCDIDATQKCKIYRATVVRHSYDSRTTKSGGSLKLVELKVANMSLIVSNFYTFIF